MKIKENITGKNLYEYLLLYMTGPGKERVNPLRLSCNYMNDLL
jgi:hypothetical protein